MLTRAPGVGRRLAQRLVTELKDKVAGLALGPAVMVHEGGAAPASVESDAVSALINLGYRPADAAGAVRRASAGLGDAAQLESLIREGLKELSS